MINKLTPFVILLLSLILVKCANQSAPTGGEKDETPPRLVESNPQQGETNFKGKQVILTFDELVKTDNAKEQFLITPRIKGDYDIKYRKNKVIINFEEPLDDSTTYSINFREGIKDLTEGNAADTLKLAFSTGSYLDSLSISGKVTDILLNTKPKDLTIGLYLTSDTLTPFNSPPVYLTKTAADGTFMLSNLKSQQYKIYAFNDANKNLKLESKNEKYGFISESINLDSSLNEINIPITSLNVDSLELQSHRPSGTSYVLKYNKYITNYILTSLNKRDTIYSNFSDNNHNAVNIYNNGVESSSIDFVIQTIDSIDNRLVDTLSITLDRSGRKPSAFKTNLDIPKIITSSPTFDATITFNKPITNINYDSIYLYLDTANVVYFKPGELAWNTYLDEVQLKYSIDPKLFVTKDESVSAQRQILNDTLEKEGALPNNTIEDNDSTELKPNGKTRPKPTAPRVPHLYLGQGAFVSVEGDSTEQQQHDLSFIQPEELGIILIEIETDYPHYFVQLLDQKNNVVETNVNGKNFSFTNILPGEYRLRVLVDSNLNGTWEPGNILKNESPEPVYFYKSTEGNDKLILRANWELGPNVMKF